MTFEEEFPSLKKLTEVRSTMIRVPKNELDYEYGSFNGADNIALTLRVDEFSKFFLDKQRVKEAIQNKKDLQADNVVFMLNNLLRELGLED